MQFDDKGPKLDYNRSGSSGAMGLVAKVLTVVGGAIVLVSALALSVLFFAVLIVIGAFIGGYLWWKTREIRKQIRTQFSSNQTGRGASFDGEIIEGEVIHSEIVENAAPRNEVPRNDMQLKDGERRIAP